MGKVLIALLVVVATVGIGGFVNYQRNAPLDAELQNRPYGTISDADLAALIAAYEGEKTGLENRLKGYSKDRTRVMNGLAPADLQGKLTAFDSFQRKNESWRETNRAKLGHEIELEKLQKEKNIRDRGLHIERNRIIRRITTF